MYLITRQTASRILAHVRGGVLSHALVTAAVPLIAAVQAVRHSIATRPGRHAVVAAMNCQVQALQVQHSYKSSLCYLRTKGSSLLELHESSLFPRKNKEIRIREETLANHSFVVDRMKNNLHIFCNFARLS